MKSLSAGLIVLPFLISSTWGAVTFSGGTGGNPVVMTITSDLHIPLSTAINGPRVGFVLEDVYATGRTTPAGGTPTTNTITGYLGGELTSVVLVYSVDFGAGAIDPNDLYVFFDGGLIQAPAGAVFTIRAGSMTLPASTELPDFQPTAITAIIDENGIAISNPQPIPEPSAILLGAAASLALLRRRR